MVLRRTLDCQIAFLCKTLSPAVAQEMRAHCSNRNMHSLSQRFVWWCARRLAPLSYGVRSKKGARNQPKVFGCIKFFQIRDVPTQIPEHPGHSLSKTTEKCHLHKVFVRDIPTSGSRMSQEYPAQKLYVWAVFSDLTKGYCNRVIFAQLIRPAVTYVILLRFCRN